MSESDEKESSWQTLEGRNASTVTCYSFGNRTNVSIPQTFACPRVLTHSDCR